MFHSGTQTLIDRWAALPRTAGLPTRADFEPLLLGALVPQLFSARRADHDAILRLAGGWIEAFHGEPLQGRSWLDLWAPGSRSLVASAIVQTVREARPVVIVAEGSSPGRVLEIVITPFRAADGTPDRLIGLYQPTSGQQLKRDAPEHLVARLSVGVGEQNRPALTLASLEGRRIA